MKKLTTFSAIGVFVALLAAPIMMVTRPAEAVPTFDQVCYFGQPRYPLGIVIDVDPDLADALVRARIASYSWDKTSRSFRGYPVCQPVFKRRR